ncbi:MAG: cation:proton antiporter [Bacteroidales bacterium]|nr:cation:proton antiporter [Bacteroidales bacterium]
MHDLLVTYMPPVAHLQLPLIVTLLLLLLSARVLGELFERAGVPAMVGEVLAGVLLGPSVLNLVASSQELNVISDLAVFLLIILAGMEISPEEIRTSFKPKNIWFAIFGFSVPFASGVSIGYFMGYSPFFALFIGLCLSITALPVIIRILMDLGKIQSYVGKQIISVAIFNDIVSLLILGILLDFQGETNSINEFSVSVVITVLKLILLIALLYAAYHVIKFASKKLDLLTDQLDRLLLFLKGKESMFALVMLFILVFASISELLGMYFMVGAFFGTILIPRAFVSRTDFKRVKESASGITSGFLSPIFFAAMGASFSIGALDDYVLLIILLGAVFASKLVGGFLGGKLSGMGSGDAFTLGIGINAGGAMALVIANIALNKNLIDLNLFSILVLIALITTLITPMLLKIIFRFSETRKDQQGR